MPHSLLYVSKTLLEFPDGEAEMARIVEVSLARNAALGVTGALISTPQYFAQLLEGEAAAVAELMRSIDADPRHMRIKIVREREDERRFTNWSMAYSGYASFVDRQIAPLFVNLTGIEAELLSLRLIQLMEGFARLPGAV